MGTTPRCTGVEAGGEANLGVVVASSPPVEGPFAASFELLDDPLRIGEKVMEESEEVARAAREESEERVDEEAADVLYHLLVLLRSRGRALTDAERVLDGRRS